MMKLFAMMLVLGRLFAAELLRDDGANVVIDRENGLMWQDDSKAASVKASWHEALKQCETLNLGGYSDWRLPTRDELDSLADESRFKHGIYPQFDNVGSGGYWSSTEDHAHKGRSWMTLYTCGGGFWYGKGTRGYVRCVRDIKDSNLRK